MSTPPPIPAPAPPPLPVSPESLSLTYRSTRAANWRCNSYAMFHNKMFVLIMCVCIFCLGFTLPLPQLSPNAALNIALRLIIAAGGMGLINLATIALMILTRLPTASTIRMCTTSLTPEGVRDVTPEKPRLVTWAGITEICEHDGDVHVWFGVGGIFIPREAFGDQEEARRFTQLAIELWRSKGTSWPHACTKSWRNS